LVKVLVDHRQTFPHVQLILHNSRGNPMRIDTFRNGPWRDAVEASVGKPMRPYDLRHSHVALMIAEGAHAKVIADRLGHTTIRTTMDTYGHLLEGVGDDVIDRLGRPNDDQETRPGEAGA
jgi:integrase